MPALQSHHAELRALAMRCVSLYAHAAHAAALRFWPLLLKVRRALTLTLLTLTLTPSPSPHPNPSP